MKDQFVTYEIALALKELGFKEKCLTAYTNKGELGSVWNVDPDICEGELLMEYADNSLYCINGELLLDYIAASLWQQVIDWFRDVYKIEYYCISELFDDVEEDAATPEYQVWFKRDSGVSLFTHVERVDVSKTT